MKQPETKSPLDKRQPLTTGMRKRITRRAQAALRLDPRQWQVRLARLVENYLSLNYRDDEIFAAVNAGLGA